RAEKSERRAGRDRCREAPAHGCTLGDWRGQFYQAAPQGAALGAGIVRGRERDEHRHSGHRARLWRVLADGVVCVRPRRPRRARIEGGREVRRLHPYRHANEIKRRPAAPGARGYRDAVLRHVPIMDISGGAHAACDARRPNLNSNCSISAAGLAALNKKPCTSLQPSARSQSSWSMVSTPSAVVVMLRLRPRPEIALTIATQSERCARSFTNERSILILSNGKLLR